MLSVIILTRNDEGLIKKCVESIRSIADEIIIVDSYSTDKTVEIGKELGADVYQNTFVDFSAQRNFALTLAHGDWILYLDSDEVATEEFRQEVKRITETIQQNGPVAYFVRRDNYFLGKKWGYIDRMQRLFKKSAFQKWEGKVHETAEYTGKTGEIKHPIRHFTHRDLSSMLAKTNEWSEQEADLRLHAHHPLMTPLRFIRVMGTGFFHSYIKEKGYKNGTEGVIESLFQAFSMFVTYAKLWEKQQAKKV